MSDIKDELASWGPLPQFACRGILTLGEYRTP